MKKITILLIMLLAMSAAWAQTSRRASGSNSNDSKSTVAGKNTDNNKATAGTTAGRRSIVIASGSGSVNKAADAPVVRNVSDAKVQSRAFRETVAQSPAQVRTQSPASADRGQAVRAVPPAGNGGSSGQQTARDGLSGTVTTGRRTAPEATGPEVISRNQGSVSPAASPRGNEAAMKPAAPREMPPRAIFIERTAPVPNAPVIIRPRPVNVILPAPPVRFIFYWTPEIRVRFSRYYPELDLYRYPAGYRLRSISIYDAAYFRGEVASVYGRVYEVYYSRMTDEYLLYFGDRYPYHYFTAVVPGYVAERFSRRPWNFFRNEHLVVTGLITMYNGLPEIAVRSEEQIRLY